MKRSVLPLFAGIVVVAGCASEKPYRGPEFENARKTEALPYTVKVTVTPQVDGQQPQGVMVPSVATEEMRGDIERAVVSALTRYRTFAAAYTSTPPKEVNKEDPDPAWWTAPDVKPDAELFIDITAPAGRELGTVTRNNLAWANLFLWLLAGFPGWILEDTEVDPGIQIRYKLVRTMGDSSEELALTGGKNVELRDAEQLNFWSRAGLWQFVIQIIVPPFWVSSNEEVADESLRERYVARVQRGLGENAKREMNEGTMARDGGALPIASVIPTGRDEAVLFVLSSQEVDQSSYNGTPLESWIDLNTQAGKELLVEEDVKAGISTDPALGTALELFARETGGYQQGYAKRLSRDSFVWGDKETPRKLRVRFRADPNEWTWTPRLTEEETES